KFNKKFRQDVKMHFLPRVFALFIVGFLFLGGITAIGLPPFNAPDENVHFQTALRRTHELYNGRSDAYCSRSYDLPHIYGLDRLAFQPSQKMTTGTFASQETTSSPAPCSDKRVSYGSSGTYFSAILGSKLWLQIDPSPSELMRYFYYLRVLNGFFVGLVLFRLANVIRQHKYKWGVFCLLPLLWSPLFVQQSFAVSADNIMFIFTISVITITASTRNFHLADLFVYLISGILAATTKPFIIPLALIPVAALIAVKLNDSALQTTTNLSLPRLSVREKLNITFSLMIVSAGFLYFALSGGTHAIREQLPGVNSSAQLNRLINDPLKGLKILNETIIAGLDIQRLYTGLGWLDTDAPRAFGTAWKRLFYIGFGMEAIFFIFSLLVTLQKSNFRKLMILCGCTILVAILLYAGAVASALALFLTFTPLGADIVMGMQERYYIPQFFCFACIPLVAYLVTQDTKLKSPKWMMMNSSRRQLILKFSEYSTYTFIIFQLCALSGLLVMTWLVRYW
ncbi:MAG: DUF2142 domain-containing protein, partial [Sphingobacteriales bacterium]